MNWREICKERKKKVKPLKKEISELKKAIKVLNTEINKIGPTEQIFVIAEELSRATGLHCIVGGLNLITCFDQDATPKQVQYRRPEKIFCYINFSGESLEKYFHKVDKLYGEWRQIPDSIEEIAELVLGEKTMLFHPDMLKR